MCHLRKIKELIFSCSGYFEYCSLFLGWMLSADIDPQKCWVLENMNKNIILSKTKNAVSNSILSITFADKEHFECKKSIVRNEQK